VWASSLSHRGDLPRSVRRLGEWLVGRVEAAERDEGAAGPLTLCHGDPSTRNVFTDSEGDVVFVDWEDVRIASGVVDLAWLLVSSVAPSSWPAVIEAYGPIAARDLVTVLPSVCAQGLFALSGASTDDEAAGWIERLATAAEMLGRPRA
jgi:thiamine kinase-like enzyme